MCHIGIHINATWRIRWIGLCGGGGMSQHVGGVWSADEQWSTAASGLDRRYRGGSGGGLVGVPSWYAAAAANTRHTSPPV